jgi:hypothetical protein
MIEWVFLSFARALPFTLGHRRGSDNLCVRNPKVYGPNETEGLESLSQLRHFRLLSIRI